MNKIIEYFLNNSKLNNTLLAFLLVMGIFAYIKIPKEMFPIIQLDTINITGSYAGASASSLNNFAVKELENKIDTISGIQNIDTTIKDGFFRMYLELQDGTKKNEVLNDVKDAISSAKRYFPKDMSEPIASSINFQRSLMGVSLISKSLKQEELLNLSDKLKTDILQIPHISEVLVFGDSNLQIQIKINNKKATMYGLNTDKTISAIKELSYMYPVASIEQSGNYIYLNANNNKFDKSKWQNTLLQVGKKKIYLGDIAYIDITYPNDETIARFNRQNSIQLSIYEDGKADSIKLGKEIREILKAFKEQEKNVSYEVSRDRSKPLSQRLSTISSNILLGLILVGLAMHILISARMSLIIIMGIPFSFIIGIVIMEYFGISLNMISLAAMLIALGIVVDDAIIVSENIQRLLDEGKDIKYAVFNGTKQMIMPVFIASLTTMCAFLPLLFISGSMGNFISEIPIVISILILASLIESFLFLPLHAKHILKTKDKLLNWTPIHNFYEKILHFCIRYKKTFLLLFFIIIPLLIFLLIQNSRFQLFPHLDSKNITLAIKLNNSNSLEDTDKIAKKYENILFKNKDILFMKNLSTTVGRFTNVSGVSENIENGFLLKLEMYDFREDNFVNNWISPILSLSFDFKRVDEKRTVQSKEIIKTLRKLLIPIIKKDKVEEYSITTRRLGAIKTDLELKLSALNSEKILLAIEKIENFLNKTKGVSDISNNVQFGQNEYKYSVNNYGQNLGLNDVSIANALNNYFSEKEQATTYNDDGIVKIKTWSNYKNNIDELKNFLIPTNDGKFVSLEDVVTFKIERNFERIEKEDGKILKKVFANVDNKIINASETLEKLQTLLNEIKKEGVEVNLGGEAEASTQMKNDMLKAIIVALFLIFLTLLLNFPSYLNAFIIISVIPFTMLGPLIGHFLMGVNLNSQTMVGMLGLAGVVINDGIVMLDFLQKTKTKEEFYKKAKQRVRPIFITSLTTFIGLSTLMFFPASRESIILQPIAISLGFGIAWGTILNLIYVPVIYATIFKIKEEEK